MIFFYRPRLYVHLQDYKIINITERTTVYYSYNCVIMHTDNDSTDEDCEEIVEETLIHVVVDNADEMSILNANSKVRVIAVDSDSPALQIDNKVSH